MLKTKIIIKQFFLILAFIPTLVVAQKVTDLVKLGLKMKVQNLHESKFSLTDDGTQQLISEKIYHFDQHGYFEKIEHVVKGKLKSTEVYDYKPDSNKIIVREYNADGSLYLTSIYQTDHNGCLTEAKFIRKNQKQYDGSRNTVDVEFEKFYNELYSRVEYTTDRHGLIWEEKYFKPDGSLRQRLTHTYNYLNRKLETKYYNDKGKLSWKKKFRYKKKKKLTDSKIYIDNRPVVESDYDYVTDDYDNWIQRTETREVTPNIFTSDYNDNTIIILREITYFPDQE